MLKPMKPQPSQYTRSLKARRLRGIAALEEMLSLIGATNTTDGDVAKVLVENELELRELVASALLHEAA